MFVNKILKAILLLLGGAYVVLQGLAYEFEGAAVSSVGLILLTLLYCKWTENKANLFFWFLIAFTSAHVLSFISYLTPPIEENQVDYYYYGANALYIIYYVFLIIRILRGLNFKRVFSELAMPILILIVLDVFCVILVTDTAESELSVYEYALEFTYNAVIMALLSAALINYMYRNDGKSMMILIASICIVFSEIIQLAYYYILDDKTLVFIFSFFLVIAFLFFYLQSQQVFSGPEPAYTDEQLEEA